jgi:hypothetical protein
MKIISLLVLCLLAGCTSKAPLQSLYALDSAYIGAANAERAYADSPIADPAVVAQMKAYDNAAYSALKPLTDAASVPGASVDSVGLAVASAAVSQLTTYVLSHPATLGASK